MNGLVNVDKLNTVDRIGREVTLQYAHVAGHVLFVDVYTLIPSVKIEEVYFQIDSREVIR